MSLIAHPPIIAARLVSIAEARTRDPAPAPGPSRRRRRASRRLGHLVALCAMSAWLAVGVMPVAAALYAICGG